MLIYFRAREPPDDLEHQGFEQLPGYFLDLSGESNDDREQSGIQLGKSRHILTTGLLLGISRTFANH